MAINIFHRSNKIKLLNSDDINEMFYGNSKFTNSNSIFIKCSNFIYIFYVALFSGLPYNPKTISVKPIELSMGIKLWCFCLCVIKVFFTLLFFITGALYIPHKLTIFTFYTFGFITNIMTYHVVRFRKKIILSIRRLCELSHFISPKQKTGSKFCILQIIFLVLAFCYAAYSAVIGIYALRYTGNYEIFSLNLLDVFRISTTFVYLNGFLTTGVSVILCNNIFITLRNIIIAFRIKLKERYHEGNLCRENILEDLSMFRRILSSYQQLEACISPILLFINIMCIISFLNNLSILLTRRLNTLTTVGILITFGQALFAFIYLIFNAARVIKEYESLQQCLVRCSEGIAAASSSISNISLFTVLADNIRFTKFHFSAGDMYIIDKGLILTVGGAMITYGIIEYQLTTVG